MRCGTRGNGIFLSMLWLAGMVAFSAPAFAGFEWAAPPRAPAAVAETGGQGPDVAAAPLMPVMESAMPMAPIGEEEPVMFDTPAAPAMQASVDAHALSPAVHAPVVEGFGREIALAMALRQIVPPQYSFSFDEGISPGALVSWQGGKPWDIVLDDALAPLGLAAKVVDKTVWIRHRDATSQGDDHATADLMQGMPVSGAVSQEMRPIASDVDTPVGKPLDDKALAAIGSRDDAYAPSYPRRRPEDADQGGFMEDEMQAPAEPEEEKRSDAGLFGIGLPVSLTDIIGKPESIEPAAGVEANAPLVSEAKPSPAGQALDPYAIGFWQAEKGENLQGVLGKWAEKTGVQMVWAMNRNYTLQQPVALHGTFPDAVTAILTVYSDADPRPAGKLYPNLPDGPSVLIVQEAQ